jgi:hypothetical protein
MVPRLAAAGACALALGLLAGCGGGSGDASNAPQVNGAAAVAASLPKVSAPTAPGGVVRPGPGTPKAFTKAVLASKPVVVAFLMPGAADDEAVRGFIRNVRGTAAGRNVAYFTFSLKQARRFGDLPELLDVSGTPTVVVIGRDHRVVNVFRGLTDSSIIKQAVHDAKDAPAA